MALVAQEMRYRRLHFIEGTAGTPNGALVIALGDQPEFPLVTPRPTTELQLDGGGFTNNVVQFISNPDAPFQPVDFSITVTILPEQLDLLHMLGNPFNESPWLVGGQTWVPTTALGQRYDDSNTLVNCLGTADEWQKARMLDVVSEHVVPASAPTGISLITRARGVVLTGMTEQSSGGGGGNAPMTATCNFQIFGAVERLANVPSYTAATLS